MSRSRVSSSRAGLGILFAALCSAGCGSGSGGGSTGGGASSNPPSTSTPATPPPFTNGSFERGLVGWETEGVRAIEAGLGAFHGSMVLEFDPAEVPGQRFGHARARIVTEPGREYRLTLATQAGFALGRPNLAITIDGDAPHDVIAALAFPDPGVERELPVRSGWLETSVRFFAERPMTELQLGPLSRWAPYIGWGKVWVDHVRIEPEEHLRALGTDVEVRATLPSDALVGEELELTVSLLGKLRKPDGGYFDERPVHHSGEFLLESGDPAASLPPKIVFQGEATRVVRVRFGTAGVRRVTLRASVPGSGGFEARSNPVLVRERAPERRSYWGDIHVHTDLQHADWLGGDAALNYTFARDFADLDFAALSEHFGWQEVSGWMDRLVPPTLAFDEPGRFATFLAVETATYQGHHNFYLRGSDPFEMFDNRNVFGSRDAQLANLRARGVTYLVIPHHFMLLDPVDWRSSDRDALRLAEIYSNHGTSEEAGAWWRHPDQLGLSYRDSQGARGHDFQSALARGQRIGAIACSDSHVARPGLVGLTCLRASALTREALFDALRRRDCYATSGERTLLDFELAGGSMGQELFLTPGSPLEARVEVHASGSIAAVELVREGAVVAAAHPGSPDFTGTFALGSFSGTPTSVYARVRQQDEHRAWSSPIWIDPAGKADLVLEKKDLSYDFRAGELAVTPRNYGDASARATLRIFSSASEPSFADVAVNAFTQPTLLLRIEPVSASRARLKATLYSPRELGREFFFSGEIRVWNAQGYAIVADPRRMLADDRQGTLSWNDLLGTLYERVESHAGQITDFELLIDTRPDTLVDVAPLIDGAPLAEVWLGSDMHDSPLAITIPLGELAQTPALDERELELDPASAPVRITFASLPPGATYIAVLDPDGRITESDEHDNAALLGVPEVPQPYNHWPDYPR